MREACLDAISGFVWNFTIYQDGEAFYQCGAVDQVLKTYNCGQEGADEMLRQLRALEVGDQTEDAIDFDGLKALCASG
jgi:hypothetical protein